MIKRAIILTTALVGLPVDAADRPPDDVAVSATIAALKAGDATQLEWLVSHIGTLQFYTMKPADRAEAFKLLSGCKAREQSRGLAGPFAWYEYAWKCRKQTFIGKLVPDKRGKNVALVDFLPKAEHKEWLRRMPVIALPPTPIRSLAIPPPETEATKAEEEQRRRAEMAGKKELAGLFAQAVTGGDMTAFLTRHATEATITYGFFDPYSEQDYVDRSWHTGETLEDAGQALSDAVAHAQSQLGKPESWACEDAYPYVECTWRYGDPGKRLNARIHVFRKESDNWGVIIFKFRYETAAMLGEARRRAAR